MYLFYDNALQDDCSQVNLHLTFTVLRALCLFCSLIFGTFVENLAVNDLGNLLMKYCLCSKFGQGVGRKFQDFNKAR